MKEERTHEEKEEDHCCDHGHETSRIPAGVFVTVSGLFTAVGFALKWSRFQPALLAEVCFAIATIAGCVLVVPAAWRA